VQQQQAMEAMATTHAAAGGVYLIVASASDKCAERRTSDAETTRHRCGPRKPIMRRRRPPRETTLVSPGRLIGRCGEPADRSTPSYYIEPTARCG